MKKYNISAGINMRIWNPLKFAWWAFANPLTISAGNFKMLSDLLLLIMKVASEDRPRMTHIAYVHPEEGEKQIVSIWAGAGMGAEPTKRIGELISENAKLKEELSKHIAEKK